MTQNSHHEPDKFQQAWQTQSSATRVAVDTDLLLKEVQRNQREFLTRVSLNDCAEIGIALLLIPVWIYMGVTMASPWTWYLAVPAFLWVIGFLLVFRARYERPAQVPNNSLLSCVRESLALIEHRIWLKRNAFWWSILPMVLPLLVFTAHVSWLKFQVGSDALQDANAIVFVALLGLMVFLYKMNERVAKKGLYVERRQELLALLASLGDETTDRPAVAESGACGTRSVVIRRVLVAAAVSCLVTLATFLLASGKFDALYGGVSHASGPDADALATLVRDECQQKHLIGLAAMVMVDGKIDAAAAYGERMKGSGVPVEASDRWHLAGITKSITATMIARLIESGKMKWTDTVGEIFPDAAIHPDWKPVTLRQLLTDTAGAPKNFSLFVRLQTPPLGPERTAARRKAVLDVIAAKPTYTPGTQREYSNVGYVIAGAMAEKVTGETWEDLVKQEVFAPLELAHSGFGPPASDASLPQPRGHRSVLIGKIAVDDQADNTPIMGPSGSVHMTLEDLCNFAREHMQGEQGTGKLLSTETFHKLHTPEFEAYACGWAKRELSPAIPYAHYWHNGTNTMWYALVVVIPDKNMVIAVTSNDGDWHTAESAAIEIVVAVTNNFRARADRTTTAQPVSYPKKSPYAAIRWNDSQPEVQLDGKWYRLLLIDDLPTANIVAFSLKNYGDLWQKRFEEDLVELLTRMGQPPQDTVTLVVQSLDFAETKTLKDVPMTEANRQAIWDAAREEREPTRQPQDKLVPPQGKRDPVPIDDAELFRSRVDEFLTAAHKKAGFNGAVIVARGGKPVYGRAFGFSHLNSKAPNTLDTPFRIASLSKQFTAAAIFRLAGQGKLDIDDPVHKYLPEFANAPYRDITIHHLLTHSSGLPRSPESIMGAYRWYNMSQNATPVDDYVRLAVETPLESDPGTKFEYSNFGFRVLAALITRVTGREYADFMDEEIFQPLKMNDSGVARVTRPPSEARIAEGLRQRTSFFGSKQGLENGEMGRNFGAGYGSGGIFTSANDLVRWDRALASNDFLSADQKERLFQPIHDHYACGWFVKKSGLDGRVYQMHNGANEGFFSQMMRIPATDRVIIAVGNIDLTPELSSALNQLFRLCRSLPYRDP